MARQSKLGWAAQVQFQALFLLLLLTASCDAHAHDAVSVSSSLSILTRRAPPPPPLSATIMTPALTLELRGGSSSSSWGTSTRMRTPSLQPQGNSGQKQMTTAAPVKTEPPAQIQATEDDTKEMLQAFLTRDSRNSFISRVYAILAGQLLVTALSCVAFGIHPSLADAMHVPGSAMAAVPWVSLAVSTIAWFCMCLSPDSRRKAPRKWQLLAFFTLGEAISVGFLSSFYKFQSVVLAMGSTALAAVSVSAYTILNTNAKYDLSQWGQGLSSAGLIFLVYGLIGLFQEVGWLPPGVLPYTDMLYSLIGSVLFSFYLAHHTKLIVGGKHAKYQMNDQDYVFGAMALYNDIINMFIYILRILGNDKDK